MALFLGPTWQGFEGISRTKEWCAGLSPRLIVVLHFVCDQKAFFIQLKWTSFFELFTVI
jgi:hypothetical protein